MSRASNAVLLFVVIALAAALPREAQGGDSWSTPFPGVRRLYRTTSTPWRINALVVNLCAAGVSVRATASSERKRTVSSFAKLVGAEAAINGDFFSYSTYAPNGLAIGEGKLWGGSDSGSHGFIAFGKDQVELDGAGKTVSSPPGWMKQAAGGYPYIVVDGKALTSFSPSHCPVRHPRTAVGLSRDRHTLFMVVVDGRSSSSVGMTCAELGKLLHGLGAHDALNFDGGGSSTMWLKGKGVINNPSDGGERVVANHLAIHAHGSGTPGSCDRTVDELDLQMGIYDAPSSSDIDGDGRADACGRGVAGVSCVLSTGAALSTAVAGPKLSDASGWGGPSNFGTIRMGDIDGDGKLDLCGRCKGGVSCWLSKGSSFGAAIEGPAWTDAAGWSSLRYFSTLRLADVSGDGKADLCARSASDFRCHLSKGTSLAGSAVIGPKLSDSGGWGDYDHFSTIRMADVNGDGKADLCARSNGGWLCWPSKGNAFGAAVNGPALSDASSWNLAPHFRTIRIADVNGDGKADLCGRGSGGLSCWISDGAGFPQKIAGPAWSNADGWDAEAYYATIRAGGPACVKRAEICDGRDNDCDGAVDEDGVCGDAGPPPEPDLGPPPETGDGGGIPTGDGWYWGDLGGDFEPWSGSEEGTGCGCGAAVAAPRGARCGLLLAALLSLALGRRRRRQGSQKLQGRRPGGSAF